MSLSRFFDASTYWQATREQFARLDGRTRDRVENAKRLQRLSILDCNPTGALLTVERWGLLPLGWGGSFWTPQGFCQYRIGVLKENYEGWGDDEGKARFLTASAKLEFLIWCLDEYISGAQPLTALIEAAQLREVLQRAEREA